jgi:hypothetical protein
MGYWDEKKEYEREQEQKIIDLTEKLKRAQFCNSCGKKLTKNNVKGMCVECKEIICKDCAEIKKGKILCSDCHENLEEIWICENCDEEFVLGDKEIKELEKKGEISVKCPNCKKKTICDLSDIKKTRASNKLEEGVIPLWLVIVGFFFYIFPGVIFLIIRLHQINKNREKYHIR